MNIVVCKQCGDLLQSKHNHDFVMCGCPNETFTDGGDVCPRRGGVDLSKVLSPLTGAEARRLSAMIKDTIELAGGPEVDTF